jgi:hypothetical protein
MFGSIIFSLPMATSHHQGPHAGGASKTQLLMLKLATRGFAHQTTRRDKEQSRHPAPTDGDPRRLLLSTINKIRNHSPTSTDNNSASATTPTTRTTSRCRAPRCAHNSCKGRRSRRRRSGQTPLLCHTMRKHVPWITNTLEASDRTKQQTPVVASTSPNARAQSKHAHRPTNDAPRPPGAHDAMRSS